MKHYFLFMLFCFYALSITAQPPNNLIFYGGSGDGAAQSAYAIAANNIFSGGAGDGAGYALNGVLPNSIYLGGVGDGFSNQSNNVVSNNIFFGSEGDGFAHSTNTSLPNNIFVGGEGDGWHAVVLPLGPLPVKLLSFTAAHVGKAHVVKWETAEEINTQLFEVQRSSNARDYHAIGTVVPIGGVSIGASYNLEVNDPFAGDNFYRLKIIDNDGSFQYSNVVLLKNAGSLQVSVYPNPTAEMLIVRLPTIINSVSIKAEVIDAQGRLILQPLLVAGPNSLAVATLPAGFYTLRFMINGQLFALRFMKVK